MILEFQGEKEILEVILDFQRKRKRKTLPIEAGGSSQWRRQAEAVSNFVYGDGSASGADCCRHDREIGERVDD